MVPQLGGARVEVAGGAGLHALVWEALRLPSGPQHLGSEVVRIPEGVSVDTQQPAPREARLNWLGARPFGEHDVPRYRLLAPVLRHILVPGSAVVPGTLRTDAALEDLNALVADVEPDTARVLHLDAHGLSSIVPGETQPLDEVFSFVVRSATGPVVVFDRALLASIPAYEYDLFTTNACFAAQQRGVAELPFPGQLVQCGVRVTLAAREPLGVDAATHLYTVFYAELSAGQSIGAALAFGLEQLSIYARAARPTEPRDLTARLLMQPLLWARSGKAIDESFTRQRADAPRLSEPACYTVALMEVGGSLAALAASLEDHVLATPQKPIRISVSPGTGWRMDCVREATGALLHALGSRRPPDSRDEPSELTLAPATAEERLTLVKGHFDGPDSLLELLASAAPEDLAYLHRLSLGCGGDAVCALIEVLAWGTAENRGDPAGVVATALRERGKRLCTLLVPPEPAPAAETHEMLSAAIAALPLALPVAALVGECFQETPVPPLWTAESIGERVSLDAEVGEIASDGEHAVGLPRAAIQLAARAAVPPEAIALLRAIQQEQGLGLPPKSGGWSSVGQRVTLSWLALAVAARQAGGVDWPALVQAILSVASREHSSSLLLLRQVREGRLGWEPLAPGMVEVYEELEQKLHSAMQPDWARVSADAPTVDHALAALKAGQLNRVFELMRSAGEAGFAERKTLAYALARDGRTAEARQLILPDLRRLSMLSPFELCELLHLLGHIAELDRKPQLAIRYMLEEHDVDPPHEDVRLHNRTHLLRLLRDHDPAQRELRISLSAEAVGLALIVENEKEMEFALQTWVEIVLGSHEEAGLDSVLEETAGFALAADSRVLALVRAIRADGHSRDAQQELERLADGADWAAAEACHRLAMLDGLSAETRELWLRQGTASGSGAAAIALLDALWEDGRLDEFEATAVQMWRPNSAVVLLAIAALAERRGQRAAASEALSALIIEAGLVGAYQLRLARPWGEAISTETDKAARDAVWGRLSQGLLVYAGEDAKGEPPSNVSHSLKLLREFADNTLARPGEFGDSVRFFNMLSERLWDRDELELAAQARGICCRMAELDGDDAHLAEQLGWLATLEKLCGRPSQAERFYQLAIELGKERLGPQPLGSLFGRYGNLLHAQRQFKAAVAMQWRGVCARCAECDLDTPMSGETLQTAASERETGDVAHSMAYLLLLANLANCLFDNEQVMEAVLVVEPAVARFHDMVKLPDAADAPNTPEARRMLDKVQRRLGKLASTAGEVPPGA